MARIGKRILDLPKGVEIKAQDGVITVKGPKGTLLQAYRPEVKVVIDGAKISTVCEGNDSKARSLHGLYNSLLKNMLVGVTIGFQKDLELIGVGYRAQLQGKKLQLSLGFSHPVEVDPPEGVSFEVEGQTKIKVKGMDRQVVGETAAHIRSIREVEPYKGKGVRYLGEKVRKKAGKAAKTAGGAGA
jgi:large subunit ribosomal protein L6